jgi:hypothetical protein
MTEHIIVTVTPTLPTGQAAATSIREIESVPEMRGAPGPPGPAGDTYGTLEVCFDKTYAPVYYVGEAQPGSNEDSPVWRIKKIDNSGEVMQILFAGGKDLFNQIWSDHLTLTYS